MKEFKNISYGPLDAHKLDLFLPETQDFDLLIYFHVGGLEGGSRTAFL